MANSFPPRILISPEKPSGPRDRIRRNRQGSTCAVTGDIANREILVVISGTRTSGEPAGARVEPFSLHLGNGFSRCVEYRPRATAPMLHSRRDATAKADPFLRLLSDENARERRRPRRRSIGKPPPGRRRSQQICGRFISKAGFTKKSEVRWEEGRIRPRGRILTHINCSSSAKCSATLMREVRFIGDSSMNAASDTKTSANREIYPVFR